MSYNPINSTTLYTTATASLANGGTLDSGWLDLTPFASYEISVFAGAEDLELIIDSSEVDGGSGVNDIQSTTVLKQSFLTQLPRREPYIRFRVSNSTGVAVTNVKFFVSGLYTGTGGSVFPDYVSPAEFSPALTT